jgi:3-hydroxybutyryl-CoA dehydrogenase
MAKQAIGVIGAGTMGSGIAQLAAQCGYDVIIRDVKEALVAEGLTRIEENLAEAAQRDIIDNAEATFERVSGTTDIGVVTDEPTFIIEAVPEEITLKKSVFEELDENAGPDTVLASNTSSISVTEIASATDSPERVIGTHFFNPPVKMELLELVTGHHTSDDTVDRAEALAEDLGRTSILVDDFPGFATSRLGVVLGMEAARMVEQGVASAEDIDTGMKLGYNFPMGPLELGDYNGWDVRMEIGETLADELGRDVFKPPTIVRQMVRAGDLGKKTGQGFYNWEDDQ